MGMFDTFIKKDGYGIQVKCFNEITGGSMEVYNIGDEVPCHSYGYDFEEINQYGLNYNIFPYRLEEDVILIRNGEYVASKKYYDLTDEDCEGILCIGKNGEKLSIDLPIDYIDLYKSYCI